MSRDEMTISQVKTWLAKLPQNQPLLVLDRKPYTPYTPRRILQEIEQGTDLGRKLYLQLQEEFDERRGDHY